VQDVLLNGYVSYKKRQFFKFQRKLRFQSFLI